LAPIWAAISSRVSGARGRVLRHSRRGGGDSKAATDGAVIKSLVVDTDVHPRNGRIFEMTHDIPISIHKENNYPGAQAAVEH